jgi:hypothetical protein
MVTDHQVRRLRKLSNTEKNQEIAASKAGMDPKTARRYLAANRLPGELGKERHWRTREDPFHGVWDQLRQQIEETPGLEAKTLFERLQREYPGRFSDGQIRTLQRRIKTLHANIDETVLPVIITEQGENRNQCEDQRNLFGFPHGFTHRGT